MHLLSTGLMHRLLTSYQYTGVARFRLLGGGGGGGKVKNIRGPRGGGKFPAGT